MNQKMELRKFQRSLKSLKDNRLLAIEDIADFARLDVGREKRKGLPEIILAEGKAPADVGRLTEAMIHRTGRAIISRADSNHVRAVKRAVGGNSTVEYKQRSHLIVVKSESFKERSGGGKVGILTAGTSDIPVAEEAETIAKEMGCETRVFYDAGVAGLHRLFEPLREMLKWGADVILVVAGREGALPTVVTGLVDVPVVGVPTSSSYGFGEKGLAALAAMLQSCSLGMSVVNIDGGVGAGTVGGLIANRVAEARKPSMHMRAQRR